MGQSVKKDEDKKYSITFFYKKPTFIFLHHNFPKIIRSMPKLLAISMKVFSLITFALSYSYAITLTPDSRDQITPI